MLLATKTLELINKNLERDGGAAYRKHLGEAIKLCNDAFDPKVQDGFRDHLGASIIGRECSRDAWYTFRWATLPVFPARILRLFNRGHLEEARFIALLRQAGIQTWHTAENGKQFRITGLNPHFGGSLDGVGLGFPEIDGYTLNEFKTHNAKSFTKLVKEGVVKAKPEHFSQCVSYMYRQGLKKTVYMAVNKDNDDLHLEILDARDDIARFTEEKAAGIIESPVAPPKCNNSPSWYTCKFCSHSAVCHYGAAPIKTCRSCEHAKPEVHVNGSVSVPVWTCSKDPVKVILDSAKQRVGCPTYKRMF